MTYSTREVSKLLNISHNLILQRAKILKIVQNKENRREHLWNLKQIELIKNYKKKKKYTSLKEQIDKIEILDYYFNNFRNSVPIISEKLNYTEYKVKRVIDEYFKNNFLIIESKLNYN